jgi:hypothetical protein
MRIIITDILITRFTLRKKKIVGAAFTRVKIIFKGTRELGCASVPVFRFIFLLQEVKS